MQTDIISHSTQGIWRQRVGDVWISTFALCQHYWILCTDDTKWCFIETCMWTKCSLLCSNNLAQYLNVVVEPELTRAVRFLTTKDNCNTGTIKSQSALHPILLTSFHPPSPSPYLAVRWLLLFCSSRTDQCWWREKVMGSILYTYLSLLPSYFTLLLHPSIRPSLSISHPQHIYNVILKHTKTVLYNIIVICVMLMLAARYHDEKGKARWFRW